MRDYSAHILVKSSGCDDFGLGNYPRARGARADNRAGEALCQSASTSNEFLSTTCEGRETVAARAREAGPCRSPRQLRAFTLVAEAGSFSLASQGLHLKPSAVSLLARELEATLHFQLLERTTRRVLLTPAGREFMPPRMPC